MRAIMPISEITKMIRSNELDAEAIAAAGYGALPIPEFLSQEELLLVGETIGAEVTELWTFEFNHQPEYFFVESLAKASAILDRDHYKNILVKFTEVPLNIWMPEGSEYFVIFGAKNTLQKITKENIFQYTFSEYIEEEHHSKQTQDYLRKIKETYSIA
jgi:hypothetical protein